MYIRISTFIENNLVNEILRLVIDGKQMGNWKSNLPVAQDIITDGNVPSHLPSKSAAAVISGTYGWRPYPLDPCSASYVYICRLALIYAGFERICSRNAIVSSRRCGDNSSFTGQLTQSRTSGSLSISLCHVANRFRIVMLPYFAIAPQASLGCRTWRSGYSLSTHAFKYWLLPNPPTRKIPL